MELEKALEELNGLGVEYELQRHPAVYTIKEIDDLGGFEGTHIIKNLFICDDKGRESFLVLSCGHKRTDLKELADKLNVKKLRFGSENRLNEQLGLLKGAVSPLGIINDKAHTVTLVIDRELSTYEKLGVHPNDNTATVIMSYDSLMKILEHYGNPIIFLEV